MSNSLKQRVSIEPKGTHYHSNGSGRDNYITVNGGGFFRGNNDNSAGFQIGTFGGRRAYKPINNYRPNKHIHYRNDGTGRDTYVGIDEGGLTSKQYSRYNHMVNLRNYNHKRQMSASQETFFRTTGSTVFSKSERLRNTSNFSKQFNNTQRLSIPKFSQDPYAELRPKTSLPGLRSLY
ncbi:hypothetical protein PPERSA_06608 [Pseudocohnilembus persalinus]|uniref:Uncharacterized protein n=1 Tax=Pseudocohnilembus persalinus TaxID=266149 RepID=A0A0V0QRL9_PSEPJ|nr:hypothetical protein PPERSA_06608 [Pseudocohnilembus persalinus]|eukprot:KRX04974.1 hypothetical protein PPERSA_06608 [Pseudocohnilembus persalinus]